MSQQTLLSKSQIFAAKDLKEETVPVPEWGGSVRLVQMTARESAEFSKKMETTDGGNIGIYLMLVYAAQNADNTRVFTEEDIEHLKDKNMNVLILLQQKALDLNGMSVEAKAALKKG